MKREEALEMCRELSGTFQRLDEAAFLLLIGELVAARRIFVAGAGRTGLLMQSLAMVLTQLGLSAEVVGSPTARSIRPGDLLLVGSSSGSTKTMQLYAGIAAEAGARIALITSRADSPVGRLACCTLVLTSASDSGSTERSVNLMGAGFLQALNLVVDLVVSSVLARTGGTEEQMLDTHANLE